MKKHYLFLLLFIGTCFHAACQNNTNQSPIQKAIVNLYAQILVQPEEKIYLQTDRPYYLNGERLYFRAFLLHASSMKQADWSRYIYVELLSPVDTVVLRQQIRLQDDNMFYGTLQLPESLPEGNYRLRAYTRYMENSGEAFFYTKSVFIADPNASKTIIDYSFDFLNDKQVKMNIKFKDLKTNSELIPEMLRVHAFNGKSSSLEKPTTDGTYEVRFDANGDGPDRMILVEFRNSGRTFKKFLSIPYQSSPPEVTFYPEGGQLIAGQANRIAFKAILRGGLSANISGTLFNQKDEPISNLNSLHEGMGSLTFTPVAGDTYYAKYDFMGETTKVNLAATASTGFSLHTQWEKDCLSVNVVRTDEMPSSVYYLLVHHQGVPVYLKPWDFSRKEIKLAQKLFVTGVNHLVFLDADLHPISERLVFNSQSDQIEPEIKTSKKTYQARERIDVGIQFPISTADSIPPSFALSVTDDQDVKLDTTTNIVSEILLASELRGQIENPLWYFNKSPETVAAADLLMQTNGWRRYNVAEALQNNLQKPTVKPETSQSFSGTIKGLLGKSYKNGKVKMMAVGYHYSDMVESEEKGKFQFKDFEFPDSTAYFFICYNDKSKLDDIMELKLDPILYPAITRNTRGVGNTSLLLGPKEWASFTFKANSKYLNEFGMRQVDLPEVTVRVKKEDVVKRYDNKTGGIEPDRFLSPESIGKNPPTSFDELFSRLPGAYNIIPGEGIKIRNQIVRFALNGIVLQCTYDELPQFVNVSDIAQVDLYRDISKTIIFGASGAPIIALTTWPPGENRKREIADLINRKLTLPLGFQNPVEFYSPKYDTPQSRNNNTPDLRTTIYWKPNMKADSTGKASVSFYTADAVETSYTAVVEGFTNSKKLIYIRKKAFVQVKK